MKFLKKLFQKETNKPQSKYAYLGSVGVSPNKMYIYQDTEKLLEEFKLKYKK